MVKQSFNLTNWLNQLGERMGESNKAKLAGRKASSWCWIIVRAVIMTGLSFVLLYPLLYMTSMALRPGSEIFDATVIWVPRNITFENISGAVETLRYWESLQMTLGISFVSAMMLLVSCSLTGYGFARFTFKGRGPLFVIVLLSIIIPPQTTMISQYILNAKFDFFGILALINMLGADIDTPNLLNTVFPFYLPAIFANGVRSGLLIFIFRQFFRGMPKELEDAAYIDGAGPLKTYVRVMVPNARAAFLTVFLFSTVWYWNDYFFSSAFLSTSLTLSVRLASMPNFLMTAGQFQGDPFLYITQLQAGCLLTIFPMLVLFIVFQRYFVESIEKTGIVG